MITTIKSKALTFCTLLVLTVASSANDEKDTCIFCLEELVPGSPEQGGVCTLPCNHKFHVDELNKMFEINPHSDNIVNGEISSGINRDPRCPVCREPVVAGDVRPDPAPVAVSTAPVARPSTDTDSGFDQSEIEEALYQSEIDEATYQSVIEAIRRSIKDLPEHNRKRIYGQLQREYELEQCQQLSPRELEQNQQQALREYEQTRQRALRQSQYEQNRQDCQEALRQYNRNWREHNEQQARRYEALRQSELRQREQYSWPVGSA